MPSRFQKLILTSLGATLLNLLIAGAALADEKKAEVAPSSFSVFDAPAMANMLSNAFGALKVGRFADAEQIFRHIIDRYPDQHQNYYLLATVLSARNKRDEALEILSRAIDKGFRDAGMMQRDPNLKAVRDTPGFQDLAERIIKLQATEPKAASVDTAPSRIENGEALVSAENTSWLPRYQTLFSQFMLSKTENSEQIVRSGTGFIARRLNEWFNQGKAAGNIGDLYDNRDHQHSALKKTDFPQLSFIKYDDDAIAARVDYGLNNIILFNGITLGNSSTAVTGSIFSRSQPRLAMTQPSGIGKLFLQYIRNHLYVYPAVGDYGETHGDILTANTPYLVISDGKSGSDQPFLKAIASILAAFKPNVKSYLAERNLIAPTVQMLFRRGQASVQTDDDYLTYRAHPPVFNDSNIDLPRMIELAQELEIDEIPPMMALQVISETTPKKGVDDFSNFRPEILHDTPGVITRAERSTAYEKKLTISAEQTEPAEGQKLTYHWVVLRGDADRIRIEPQNEDNSVVEITVPWHAPFAAPERPDLMTSRVEIGAFVHNGENFSAPAFINLLYPANQVRKYNENRQITLIDHIAPEASRRYADPQIFARRGWRDTFRYDEKGNLLGWQRTYEQGVEDYTRDGARVIEYDSLGRPTLAERIRYNLIQDEKGFPAIEPEGTKSILEYRYQNAADHIGVARPK